MLKGGKKEEKVKKLIQEHLALVETCLNNLMETMKLYLNGDYAKAKELAYKVHSTESDADWKRREIMQQLHEGAFLPIYREGLSTLTGIIDKIADSAESSCDFLITQRPDVPGEFKGRIVELTQDSINSFPPLKEAIFSLFDDFTLVLKKTSNVNHLESCVDKDEWQTTHDIFSSGLPLAHKMHLRELIWHIAQISDVCQDVADNLENIIVQASF